MKKGIVGLMTLVAVSLVPQIAYADGFVHGYYRSDGTYVSPHYRSDPDGDFSNNWSTYGNVNPYTGEMGTKHIPSSSFGSSSLDGNSFDSGFNNDNSFNSDFTDDNSSSFDNDNTSGFDSGDDSFNGSNFLDTPSNSNEIDSNSDNMGSTYENDKTIQTDSGFHSWWQKLCNWLW